MITTDKDTTIEFTAAALKTIRNMEHRCWQIGNTLGFGSEPHVNALESLAQCATAMLGLGGRITSDGDLALFGASFIAYGVNFHAVRDADGNPTIAGTWSVNS